MTRRENRELALKSGSNSEPLIKGTPMLSIRTYLCVGVVRDVSSPTVIEPCLTLLTIQDMWGHIRLDRR